MKKNFKYLEFSIIIKTEEEKIGEYYKFLLKYYSKSLIKSKLKKTLEKLKKWREYEEFCKKTQKMRFASSFLHSKIKKDQL